MLIFFRWKKWFRSGLAPITKEIHKIDQGDQLWNNLQKDTSVQKSAITELKDKLVLKGRDTVVNLH